MVDSSGVKLEGNSGYEKYTTMAGGDSARLDVLECGGGVGRWHYSRLAKRSTRVFACPPPSLCVQHNPGEQRG